jgi:hypothetical protein
MCTTASLCSAQVDFVISTQDLLHAYSSLHAAHIISYNRTAGCRAERTTSLLHCYERRTRSVVLSSAIKKIYTPQ